uniref:Fatty-acid and retinol-binding protein 1 n=1 Tax=Steinernema glaseri TaxID=37863 RepID=A0A1I7Z2N2_9BILA
MSSHVPLILALCLVSVFSLPIPNTGEAKEIFDFLPEEAKNFYSSLTDQDIAILKELGPQLKGKDCAAACEIIKTKSEDLANRIKTLHETLLAKINAMSDIPKNFLLNAVNQLQNGGVDMGSNVKALVDILQAAKALPQAAKDEIYNGFPSLKNFLENFLPEEAKNFYSSLTDQDIAILKELGPQLKGKDCAAACEIIKTKSEDLANRIKTLHETLLAKINAMSDIPKNFLLNAVNQLQNGGVDMGSNVKALVDILQAAKALPQAAKDEIYNGFPSLKNFLESEKVQHFIDQNKNKSPEEIANLLKSKIQH